MYVIKEIEEKYTDFITSETTLESAVATLDYLKSTIPAFFSRNGEAKSIHNMYDYLSESADEPVENQAMIECCDVRKADEIYDEYLTGMEKFINECMQANIEDSSLITFKENVETVKLSDSVFIESIFGGNLNEKKEQTLVEASDNIEYLVDFMPKIEEIRNKITSLTEAVDTQIMSTDAQKELLRDSLTMMYESVVNYCRTNIENIFETYDGIIKTINNPEGDTSSDELILL